MRQCALGITVRTLSPQAALPSAARSAAAQSLAALVLLALATWHCAGPHFDGKVFRRDDVSFRLEHVPPHWRQIEITDTALAFRDDERDTTVAINGRCGKDAEDVPLQSLTQHLFLQFTERRLEGQEAFPLDGREALVARCSELERVLGAHAAESASMEVARMLERA